MKKIYKYVVAALIGFSTVSCNDFLTVLPDDQYSVEGMYKNQKDFEQAVYGVYAEVQELYKSNANWLRLVIMRSDDSRRGGERNSEPFGRFTDDASNAQTLNWMWEHYYKIVSRCNFIFDKIEGGEFSDSYMKDYIKGETHMLRAYAYYQLATQYGGVPLYDKLYSVAETKTIKRASLEETFAFAIKDYETAIGLLPEDWSGTRLGRVTKYAAHGMLARLYMFKNELGKAKPHLEAVINSGKYTMETEYSACFNDANDNGPERVWEVQFNGGQLGQGNQFITGLLPGDYTGNLMPFGGYSTCFDVSKDMVKAYEKGDLRKDLSIQTNIMDKGVVDTVSWYITKYCYYTYTPKEKNDWANNLPILRYTDVKMMYAEVLNAEKYEANGTAFTILNEVRKRAGLPVLTSKELPDQESFKQAIIKERRVEFAFEGLRWFDLLRWGIAVDVMNKFLMAEDEGEGRYQMKSHQTIFAIPFNEMTRYNDESVMWQNPGY